MAFGYESRDASGDLIHSTEDSTFTLLGTYTANPNTDHTFTGVPIMPTRVVTKLMLNQVNGDDEAYVHQHSLSGSTLTATVPTAAYDDDGNRANTVKTFFMVFGK